MYFPRLIAAKKTFRSRVIYVEENGKFQQKPKKKTVDAVLNEKSQH